jgi:hypothetical protein
LSQPQIEASATAITTAINHRQPLLMVLSSDMIPSSLAILTGFGLLALERYLRIDFGARCANSAVDSRGCSEIIVKFLD